MPDIIAANKAIVGTARKRLGLPRRRQRNKPIATTAADAKATVRRFLSFLPFFSKYRGCKRSISVLLVDGAENGPIAQVQPNNEKRCWAPLGHTERHGVLLSSTHDSFGFHWLLPIITANRLVFSYRKP